MSRTWVKILNLSVKQLYLGARTSLLYHFISSAYIRKFYEDTKHYYAIKIGCKTSFNLFFPGHIFLLVIKFKDIKFRVLNFNAGKNLVFIVKSEWNWQNKTKLRHIRKNKQTSV